ncbi:MAG: MFS transporter [Candidatus Altiarchaeota archaeon]
MSEQLNLKGSSKEKTALIQICLLAVIYSAGAGAMWFLLPAMAEKFTDDVALVGLMLSVPYVLSTLIAIPSGEFSDRVGRKAVARIGLLIVVFIGLIAPYVDSQLKFILFVAVLGVSIQLINAPARAFVMDIAPEASTSEYFGMFIASMNLGLALGPMIIGYLMRDSLAAGIATASHMYILVGLAGIVLFSMMADPVKNREPLLVGFRNLLHSDKVFQRGIRQYGKLKKFGVILLVFTILLTIADGIIWTYEPLYYQHLGLDSTTGSLILAMFIIPMIVFGLSAGRIADKYGKINALTLGMIISGAALVLFGFSTTVIGLLGSAFLTSLGLALVWASLSGLITDISANHDRGSITGVWNMVMDVGYVVGPTLGGIIAAYTNHIGAAFSIMGLLLLISLTLIITKDRKKAG